MEQAQETSYTTYCTLPIAFVTAGIVVLVYNFWQAVRNEAIRKKINAPGPRSWPFVGNLLETRKFNGIHLLHFHHIQKYGKVFSICLGRKPTVVIADPDILKQILVKDFWNFRNRFLQVQINAPIGKSVFFARDEAWKRIRATLSPSFSGKKMKGMVSLIEESHDRLMEKIEKVVGTGESVDILDWYSRLTLEVILSTAFGVQADIQNDKESLLFERVKEVFRTPWIVDILRRFPFGIYVLRFLSRVRRREGYFDKVASAIVQQRRKTGLTGRQDLMELMLTAHEESTEEGISKLTDEEIVGQCVIFLFAGYETSSNTLAYTTYHLALNEDVQEKLREEIKVAVKSNPDSTLYDLAHNIEYLDCVINESLRLNPPLAQVNRECVEDYEFNGIHIPAGLEVMIPVYFLHRDPDAWPDPEKFDPERFRSPAKDTRHQYQFMPFGTGPRSCIGMRFGLMEIKITLVKILMKYKFVRSPETQVPLKILAGATLIPENGVHVRIEQL